MYFAALPDEVLIRIFKELHVYDIINCSLTCHLFHGTIRDTAVLQYRMELDISGLEDGDAECRLSVAERLSQLRIIEQGWDNLNFRQRHRARLPTSNVWELFGGVLAHGIMSPVTRGLSFIKLPSVAQVTLVQTWQHRDLGVDIRDFTIDPAQDLVVLISLPTTVTSNSHLRKFLIHLRTMSGGERHPSALDPILSCVSTYVGSGYGFVIQIMGDFLAILLHTPFGSWGDELFIWNWKRTKLLTYLKPHSLGRIKINSVSFISPRHVIIARSSTDPAQYDHDPPALEVYDFLAALPEGSTEPRFIRRYELPQLSRNTRTVFMVTRSDPSPEPSSQSSSSHARPFYTAPSSRLLTVSMEFLARIPYSCILFVHLSSLLEGLESDSVLGNVVVPWQDWGYAKTRVMTQSHTEYTWVCYVHGTRYVQLEESDIVGLRHIRMLDFNPLAFRRAFKNSSSENIGRPLIWGDTEPSCTVVLESQSTVINVSESTFAHKVVTTLPYRDVTSTESFPYSTVMIDEGCLLGYIYPESGNNKVEIHCV